MAKKISIVAMIIISALYIVLQVMSLMGCKKETKGKVADAGKEAMKIINKTGMFPCEMPTVEDGVLVFKDAGQYQCYYDFLTKTIDGDTTDTDVDSMLLRVETSLGYTSLRSVALQKFEEMNKRGWPTLEAIPEEDWIYSRVRRSVLNQNREVKIGGDYMKYLSAEYMVWWMRPTRKPCRNCGTWATPPLWKIY
jgi:hypothetical protein